MFGQSLMEMFVQSLKHVHDPRSQHGVSQPFRTVLTITLLGLLANLSTLAEIERWAKLRLPQLQQFLHFRKKGCVGIRRLWVKKWAAHLIREQFKIPGYRSLIRLDKKVRREGKLLSYETRYFISSLAPDVVPASECQGFVLHHWDVENGLHL